MFGADAISAFEQNRQRLTISCFCQHLDLIRRAAADRVLHHDEGIVRQPEHAGDVLGRDLKRLGAQDNSALAGLFKCNAIVQTAR